MSTVTPRNQWPVPEWNADWQAWQQTMSDMVSAQDASVFGNMEGMKSVFSQVPNARVFDDGGTIKLNMTSDLIVISRTLNVTVAVGSSSDLELQPGYMIGAVVTPGAVGPQSTVFELYATAPADPSIQIFGYVTDAYTVNWFNGATLAMGDAARPIFSFLAGSGTDTERVLASAADTTAGYLDAKVVAGSGIGVTIQNPGANESIVISNTGTSLWSRTTGTPGFLVPATSTDTVRVGSGTVAQPGITSAVDTDTGFVWYDDGDIGYVSDGTVAAELSFSSGVFELSSFVSASHVASLSMQRGDDATDTVVSLEAYRASSTGGAPSVTVWADDQSGSGSEATATFGSEASLGDATTNLFAIADGAGTVTAEVNIKAEADGGAYDASVINIWSESLVGGDFTSVNVGLGISDNVTINTDSDGLISLVHDSNGIESSYNATTDLLSWDTSGVAQWAITKSTVTGFDSEVTWEVDGDSSTPNVNYDIHVDGDDATMQRFLVDVDGGDPLIRLYSHASGASSTDDAEGEWEVLSTTGGSSLSLEAASTGSATGNSVVTIGADAYSATVTDLAQINIDAYAAQCDAQVLILGHANAQDSLVRVRSLAEGSVVGGSQLVLEADYAGTNASGTAVVSVSADGGSFGTGSVYIGSDATDVVGFRDIGISGSSWTGTELPFSTGLSTTWDSWVTTFGSELPLMDAIISASSGGVSAPSNEVVIGSGAGVTSDSSIIANPTASPTIYLQSESATSSDAGALVLSHQKASTGVVAGGDLLGSVQFHGDDGNSIEEGALIRSYAGSTWSGINRDAHLELYGTGGGNTTAMLHAARVGNTETLSVGPYVHISSYGAADGETYGNGNLSVVKAGAVFATLKSYSISTGSNGASVLAFQKAHVAAPGSVGQVLSGDVLGQITFAGGTQAGEVFGTGFVIEASAAELFTLSDMGTTVKFYSTPIGSATATESFSIESDQDVRAWHNMLVDESIVVGTHTDVGTMDNMIVAGTSHDLSGVSTSDSILVGDSFSIDAQVANSAIIGSSHEISSAVGSLLMYGTSNSAGGAYGSLIGGSNNTVANSNSVTVGSNNHNIEAYSSVHGIRAKADWGYADHFATGMIDGSTQGCSQGFSNLSGFLRTTDQSQHVVPLAGTGSDSPIELEEGYLYSFQIKVLASIDGDGNANGYESWLYDITAVCNATTNVQIQSNLINNESGGVGGANDVGDALIQGNDTDNTVEVRVTANRANIYTDWMFVVYGGVKLPTVYNYAT